MFIRSSGFVTEKVWHFSWNVNQELMEVLVVFVVFRPCRINPDILRVYRRYQAWKQFLAYLTDRCLVVMLLITLVSLFWESNNATFCMKLQIHLFLESSARTSLPLSENKIMESLSINYLKVCQCYNLLIRFSRYLSSHFEHHYNTKQSFFLRNIFLHP